MSLWDSAPGAHGDLGESSFQEATGSEGRLSGTESQINCIEIMGSGVDDSPSKSKRRKREGIGVKGTDRVGVPRGCRSLWG